MRKLSTLYPAVRHKVLCNILPKLLPVRAGVNLVRLGTVYSGWWTPRSIIGPQSIVYCVGCGEDISFDLALIQQFGCNVWAYDPTPRAIAHVERIAADESRYHFRPMGLWSQDTVMTFYLPANTAHVSGSLVGLNGKGQALEVEVRRLSTLMAANGHRHIDLLKIDVEGAEYAIIDSVLKEGALPTCLLVEFDQPIPVWRTLAAIRRLREHGYDLVKIQGWNYTFLMGRQQQAQRIATGSVSHPASVAAGT